MGCSLKGLGWAALEPCPQMAGGGPCAPVRTCVEVEQRPHAHRGVVVESIFQYLEGLL